MIEKVVLGTVQFGVNYGINNSVGKPSKKSVKNILDTAYVNKIEVLDTAEAYGNSQEVIGEYHKTSNNKFKIITKYSSKVKKLPQNITDRINQNIKILGIDYLYCYMFHSFNEFKNYFHLFKDELCQLKKSGKVEKLGVSIYTNDQLNEVLKVVEIDLIQLPFNLLDNHSKRGEILIKAKQKGVEIHTRSSFLQGLFFKPICKIPEELTLLKPYLKEIEEIRKKIELPIEKISLKYPLQKEYISKIVIGVDSKEQLLKNIEILKDKVKISLSQIDAIDVKEKYLLNPANWNI